MARPRRDAKPKPVFTGTQHVERPRVISPIAHAVAQRALADIVQIGWNPAVSDEAAVKEMWAKARRALAIMGGDDGDEERAGPCSECGHTLEHVRPGKWQCNNCEGRTV